MTTWYPEVTLHDKDPDFPPNVKDSAFCVITDKYSFTLIFNGEEWEVYSTPDNSVYKIIFENYLGMGLVIDSHKLNIEFDKFRAKESEVVRWVNEQTGILNNE